MQKITEINIDNILNLYVIPYVTIDDSIVIINDDHELNGEKKHILIKIEGEYEIEFYSYYDSYGDYLDSTALLYQHNKFEFLDFCNNIRYFIPIENIFDNIVKYEYIILSDKIISILIIDNNGKFHNVLFNRLTWKNNEVDFRVNYTSTDISINFRQIKSMSINRISRNIYKNIILETDEPNIFLHYYVFFDTYFHRKELSSYKIHNIHNTIKLPNIIFIDNHTIFFVDDNVLYYRILGTDENRWYKICDGDYKNIIIDCKYLLYGNDQITYTILMLEHNGFSLVIKKIRKINNEYKIIQYNSVIENKFITSEILNDMCVLKSYYSVLEIKLYGDVFFLYLDNGKIEYISCDNNNNHFWKNVIPEEYNYKFLKVTHAYPKNARNLLPLN